MLGLTKFRANGGLDPDMPASDIIVKGAREHNLCDVSLVLPRNKLICLTGVSGSGKSSLAFDTLYAEGQRRYVESLSSFARQFLGQMPKPDVDFISGLSPSISISQKTSGKNPRSTVGTITEIYDFLRILYARVGQGYCPRCDNPISAQSRDQIIANILQQPKETKFQVLAPVVRAQKGEHRDLFEDYLKQGFSRVRVDGEILSLSSEIKLDRKHRHDVEIVIDRLANKAGIRGRLAEAVESALKIGGGTLIVTPDDTESEPKQEVPKAPKEAKKKVAKKKKSGQQRDGDRVYSADYACSLCNVSFRPPTPQMFSFNSPQGMCETCSGLGDVYTFDPELMIPDPSRSFKEGAIEILGTWKEQGRWRCHIYEGLASTMERILELEEGTLLETPWKELSEELQDLILYGAGEQNITYTWNGGNSPMKYGGKFDGVIPELFEKYRSLKSAPKIREMENYMDQIPCATCHGERLGQQARSFRLDTASKKFAGEKSKSLPQICNLSIEDAAEFFAKMEMDDTRAFVANEPLKEIRNRLGFLLNVGLNYLTLDRTAPTLSGGESQRIRLAGQIGAGLVGVLYILDEPSIGLHSRDNDRLIDTLQNLRDLGNTVIVVEHDEETMRASDHMVDFGPGPGVHGGQVVVEGTPEEVINSKASVTGQFLAGTKKIEVPEQRRAVDSANAIRVIGASHNNLKDVSVEIPLGAFVCITGVSGSGKSSLVNDILKETLREQLNRGIGDPGYFEKIEGVENLDKMIAIDQSPIGRTPRSNPGTYIKLFDEIRSLFSKLPESKKRGYKPGRFSFNVKGGRCEACEGNGSNKLEMDFLADVWVTCPVCEGARFNRETLQVKYRDKTITDVLEMSIEDAISFFDTIPKILDRLKRLRDVGLEYLKIGQPSPTLSGGEAQRIKLARELVKKSTGKTLYLLDEPTTGLHFADIKMLLDVLQNFVASGNTVLVVEHNMDVIKTADWVIDLGPDGGAGGGRIVCEGPPEKVAACPESFTGAALAKVLGTKRPSSKTTVSKPKKKKKPETATKISVRGADQHNLRSVDVDVARDKMTVFCGPSGSGKSSMAMNTIYAEGQRRYVESLSSYARQFVNQIDKPQVDQIEGLSPAIAIEQKNLGGTPRSTVGTVTEIYDYLRILFARGGSPHCPDCDIKIGTQTSDQIVDKIMQYEKGQRLMVLAPIELDPSQTYEQLWEEIRSLGFVRVRIDGTVHPLETPPGISRRNRHEVEIVIDRIEVNQKTRSRVADSIESGLSIGKGVIHIVETNKEVDEEHWKVVKHSQHLACDCCGRSFEPLSPHNFSFNSQLGWCDDCEGIGTQMGASPTLMLRDMESSLAEGALRLWPNVENELSQKMLQALCKTVGISADIPFSQLDSRQRRVIFYGTGQRWIDVTNEKGGTIFSFQFKGLYPTIDEACRISPSLRHRMNALIDEVECGSCGGSRLRDDAAAVRFRDLTMDGMCRMPLGRLQETVESWKLDKREHSIASELIREIKNRVAFLNDVGLEYLTIGRTSASLSNGEAQRIRLASQLGSGLCGVLYVLDEPTIGLHPRDNTKLLNALHRLRDLGNTLIVVEHDREVIENSDAICDFGPRAGSGGGTIVAEGSPTQVSKKRASVTGPYISGKKSIPIPSNRRPALAYQADIKPKSNRKKSTKKKAAKKKSEPKFVPANTLDIIGARHNNLKQIDVRIPLQTLTVVTGPSGCGKSSLINDVLYNSLARRLHRAQLTPGAHTKMVGLDYINKVIRVDQTPLGNSPSSNPATYTGVFELIRNLFAELPDSKIRGYTARRFSFNVPGGRCEQCSGNGKICIEMHFLPDVWVDCETCKSERYNPETLAVRYHGKSINDVLNMTCEDASELFKNIPKIYKTLQTLCDVGLDYVTLGQSAPTLSGGEAQRVKLAAELARPDTGRTLYLLDEPTTGLHFDDLAKLLNVLQRLVDIGNTVLLIEHNLDIIKAADWIIDLGPEAGQGGGQVVIEGTPEMVVEYANKAKNSKGKNKLMPSWTGEALAEVMDENHYAVRKTFSAFDEFDQEGIDIEDVAKDIKMPWEADGRRWHTADRVDRNGHPVHWDGEILERVVDYIEREEGFAETNWNSRTIVEINAAQASRGWFFHAITSETWLVKLKFRCRRNTFKREDLVKRIQLKTANEMDDVPVYDNASRIKVSNNRGAWQEVELRINNLEEIDTPEFWSFVDDAIDGFQDRIKPVTTKIEEHTPWAKLGKKWHFMEKGFPKGESMAWDFDLIKTMQKTLKEVAPDAKFNWKTETIVEVRVAGMEHPMFGIQTKDPAGLWLHTFAPTDSFRLGEVTGLAEQSIIELEDDETEALRQLFVSTEQVKDEKFKEFLKEHLASLTEMATESK